MADLAALGFEPIDHDPFVIGAPPSGNLMDPASEKRSPWADHPLAQVGRLIGERGLAGVFPPRTIAPQETMPDFWSRWGGVIKELTGKTPSAQVPKVKLEPVDHDPFAVQP